MISYKLNVKENSRTYVDSHKVFNSSIRNEKGEPKCFSCNLFGHISKRLPKSLYFMGFKGASKKYCSKNKKEISLSVIDHESSVTADKYLKRLQLIIVLFADTGASSCLLKESLAERLGINMTPLQKYLYSFGNQKCPVLQSLGASVVDFQIVRGGGLKNVNQVEVTPGVFITNSGGPVTNVNPQKWCYRSKEINLFSAFSVLDFNT
ncbi:hypothetical protein CEXT_622211 [Caerostris extrusa]|uniref:Peptidase A2 domain-containing protein n=1 Tax=Caerostris extrusa TaxID=172846 RepID=A0AAV4Y4T8_CAEEX|nr:hypothetical protein CEXT_622211 [Caerostris extrusa]